MSVCLFVCLPFVCLSTCVSQKLYVQISLNFLYLLPMTVVMSSSDDNAIRYVFMVLWITLYFYILQGIGKNERRRVYFVQFAR